MNDRFNRAAIGRYSGLVFLAAALLLLGVFLLFPARPQPASAQVPTPTCRPYNDQAVAFTCCDAAHDDVADEYAPPLQDVRTGGFIPPVILKAIGWYESSNSPTGGWTQCVNGVPFDTGGCAWGIMQVRSHMNCDTTQFNAETQQQVKYDYRYNIAMGAYILKKWKWDWHQQNGRIIGNGDPYIAEHWYYAVWAYHQWTAVNSPNNPIDNPCPNWPSSFGGCAYQDKVWWWAAHPPSRGGRMLWSPVNLTRPDPALFPTDQAEMDSWPTWRWRISDPLPVHQDWCRNCLPLVLKNYRAPSDTYEPNDSFAQAWPIETGTYDSYIWHATDQDYYKFTPTRSGAIHVELHNIPAGCDYDLYLYNGAYQLIAQSTNGGNQSEHLESWVSPGNYYVLVQSWGGSYSQASPYRLQLYWIGKATAPYPPP